MSKKEFAASVLGVVVAVIIWVTILGRETMNNGSVFYSPLTSFLSLWEDIQRRGIRGNVLGNIMLFIPFGFLLPFSFRWGQKCCWSIVIGLCFSLLVETLQFIMAKGCFDFCDVLFNCLGTAFGYALHRCVMWLRKKSMNY